jgi:hypothetical protein
LDDGPGGVFYLFYIMMGLLTCCYVWSRRQSFYVCMFCMYVCIEPSHFLICVLQDFWWM